MWKIIISFEILWLNVESVRYGILRYMIKNYEFQKLLGVLAYLPIYLYTYTTGGKTTFTGIGRTIERSLSD